MRRELPSAPWPRNIAICIKGAKLWQTCSCRLAGDKSGCLVNLDSLRREDESLCSISMGVFLLTFRDLDDLLSKSRSVHFSPLPEECSQAWNMPVSCKWASQQLLLLLPQLKSSLHPPQPLNLERKYLLQYLRAGAACEDVKIQSCYN